MPSVRHLLYLSLSLSLLLILCLSLPLSLSLFSPYVFVVRLVSFCCAVVSCGVLWCAVVWCGAVRCAVLSCAALCCALLCCAVLCCALLCCAVLWPVVLCAAQGNHRPRNRQTSPQAQAAANSQTGPTNLNIDARVIRVLRLLLNGRCSQV